MKISMKLLIGFALVGSLSMVVGVIGIMGMRKLYDAGIFMYEQCVVNMERLSNVNTAYKNVRINFHQLMLYGQYDDIKRAQDTRQKFYQYSAEFEQEMAVFRQMTDNEESLRFHDKIMALFTEQYMPGAEIAIDLIINDIPDHAYILKINMLHASVIELAEQIENYVIGIMDLEAALAKQTAGNNARTTMLLIYAQCFLLAGVVIIAAVVTLYITRSITTPIQESAEVLSQIARGDFNARVEGHYTGEFALIKTSVNGTAADLQAYMTGKMQAEHAAHESELAKGRAEAAKEAMTASLNYASRIQRNLLPLTESFKSAFSDYAVLWKPRDIVGGDIYWLKEFDGGCVLCVCDCTGHGTPGAFLTMLVVSAFEAVVREKNCRDTGDIIWQLEKRLTDALKVSASSSTDFWDVKDGCDLAVMFIGQDGSVTLSSSGTHVFICDGQNVTRIKGQRLFIGEGKLADKEAVKKIKIPADPNQKFYIASDGLYDQKGGPNNLPFGYKIFKNILLENHAMKQDVIVGKVWEAFESYRGGYMRLDDFQLIAFTPKQA